LLFSFSFLLFCSFNEIHNKRVAEAEGEKHQYDRSDRLPTFRYEYGKETGDDLKDGKEEYPETNPFCCNPTSLVHFFSPFYEIRVEKQGERRIRTAKMTSRMTR